MGCIRMRKSLRRNRKAITPAVSTMILTAAVVVMVMVAMGYANNFLSAKMAANEYTTNKQFMLTTGLQIDDMAWTVGRTQTVRYAADYGAIKYESNKLNYTFEVYQSGVFVPVLNYSTGIIMFSMPTTYYSIGNNIFQRLYPTSGEFVQVGSSAPTCQVFCIEKLPMNDGSFSRVVTIPTIRVLTSNITTQQGATTITTNYTKVYLPSLEPGSGGSYTTKSITMEGRSIVRIVQSNVTQIRVTITFPNAASGYDNTFFNFPSQSIILKSPTIASNSTVEFYIGKVMVTIGKV